MKSIAQVWEFSSSSGSKIYETLQYTDGSTSCNCPGWTRRVDARGNRSCKHTPSARLDSSENSPIGSVFELVDCTNDETYFPMGLFLSLEEALEQVRDRCEPPTDDPEEFVRMEVRERQIGKFRWWDNGKTVAKIQWVQDYIEIKDEWYGTSRLFLYRTRKHRNRKETSEQKGASDENKC